MSNPCRIAAQTYISALMASREEILQAFVAKHGFQPEEAEQVEEVTPNGRRWYVRKRKPRAGAEIREA